MMYQGYPFRYKYINSLDYRSSKDPQSFQKANVSKASLPHGFPIFFISLQIWQQEITWGTGEGR